MIDSPIGRTQQDAESSATTAATPNNAGGDVRVSGVGLVGVIDFMVALCIL
jgi:hypothetical protein